MSYFINFPQILYRLDNDQLNYKIVPNILAKVKFNDSVVDNASLYLQYDVKDGERPEDIAYKVYEDPRKHWIILIANNIMDPNYDWILSVNNFEKYVNNKYSTINVSLKTAETYANNYVVGEIVYQGGTSVDRADAEATVNAYNSTTKTLTLNLASSVFSTSANVIGTQSKESHTIESLTYNNDGIQFARSNFSHYKVLETIKNSYDRKIVAKEYKVSAKDYNHFSDSVVDRTLGTTNQSFDLNDGSRLTITRDISPITYYDYEMELNEKKRKIKVPRADFATAIENQLKQIMKR